MPDSNPDADSIFEEIRSSDRFSEMVEEIADHFHNQEYKDDRIPEIKASFREEAEEAGLSEGEANGVAGRLIGVLTSAAEEEAPPSPESKWDALEPESGPLPEDRYDELPGPYARACYPEHGIPLMLRIAHASGGDFYWSLRANAEIGGDTVHRGMILGMLLGASQGIDESLQTGLVHYEALNREIESFVDVVLSGEGHLVV